MNGNNIIKKQRTRMWRANPHCENCGVLTVLPEDCPGWQAKGDGSTFLKKVPANMATIQHKYDKLHPLRNVIRPNERRHFLWCYKCNHEHYKKHEEQRARINANKNENKL